MGSYFTTQIDPLRPLDYIDLTSLNVSKARDKLEREALTGLWHKIHPEEINSAFANHVRDHNCHTCVKRLAKWPLLTRGEMPHLYDEETPQMWAISRLFYACAAGRQFSATFAIVTLCEESWLGQTVLHRILEDLRTNPCQAFAVNAMEAMCVTGLSTDCVWRDLYNGTLTPQRLPATRPLLQHYYKHMISAYMSWHGGPEPEVAKRAMREWQYLGESINAAIERPRTTPLHFAPQMHYFWVLLYWYWPVIYWPTNNIVPSGADFSLHGLHCQDAANRHSWICWKVAHRVPQVLLRAVAIDSDTWLSALPADVRCTLLPKFLYDACLHDRITQSWRFPAPPQRWDERYGTFEFAG